MSVISIYTAQEYLDVSHYLDMDKVQNLLDAAEDEAVQYMGHGLLDPVSDPDQKPPPSVVLAVLLLLQAAYQASPDDAEKLRRAAEVKLAPYRTKWGA